MGCLQRCAPTPTALGARLATPVVVHGEDLAPRLPLAAETALFRIAQGALANAIAHANASQIQVTLGATTVCVTLTIADDGIGFDATGVRPGRASWGLAIMRERAEGVGANLSILSAPGRGTRVVVEIVPGGGMTIRVLLADDHAVIRDGLKALLQSAADISVVGEADNGRDAVRRSEELKPDVVVMDLTMPGLNGIDAARLLRQKCPTTHVVMLSMHSDAEHVFRAFEAGATGFVLKESAGEEVAARCTQCTLGDAIFRAASKRPRQLHDPPRAA
jgi:CheY-like chemotaxis protein